MLNLELDKDVVLEVEQDRLGVPGKFTLDTDIYDMVIKLAYLTKSQGGASAVNFVFETKDSKSMRYTIYITNRAGETTYVGKKGDTAGKKLPLPGYVEVDSICRMSVDKSLAEVYKSVAKKKILLRDFTQNKDVLTEVDMLIDLVAPSAKITLGIQEVRENKQALVNGVYKPTNDERTVNVIHKIYSSDRLTSSEIAAKELSPKFAPAWLEKNKGVLWDKYKPVAGGAVSGSPSTASVSSVPDLFA